MNFLTYQIIIVLVFSTNTIFSQNDSNFLELVDKFNTEIDSLLIANPVKAIVLIENINNVSYQNDSLELYLSTQLKKISYYSSIDKLDSVYVNLKSIEKRITDKRMKFESLDQWSDVLNSIDNSWANYYYKIANYNKAADAFERAIEKIYEQNKNSLELYDYYFLVSNYSNLGKIASISGDYKNALLHYKRCENFLDSITINFSVHYSNIPFKALIAEVYYLIKKHEKSINILNECILKRLTGLKRPYSARVKNEMITNHHLIARNYLALNLFSKADEILEHSKAFYRSEEPYLTDYFLLNANLFSKKGDLATALNFLNDAKENQTNNNQQFAFKSFPIYLEIGNVFKQQNEYEKALSSYKQAEKCLFKQEIDAKIFSIRITGDVSNKKEMAELLVARSNCLQQWYFDTDSFFYLQKSKVNIDLALETLESLRQEYTSADARQFLIENSYPVFEKAIAINKQLWELTNEPKYFEAAFQTAEKSKSLSLSDALKKETALKATGISDEALNNEKQFQYQIYQLKKQIAKLKEDSFQLAKNKDELFKLNEAYKDFNQQLELDYPLYYQLKYQPNIVSLNKLQTNILSNSSALVEYFFGEDNLYAFYIDQHNLKLTADSAVHQIKLSGQNFINSIVKEDNKTYLNEAVYLKEHLLKSELIEPSIKKLTIIPDGQIAYIPFEVLLTETIDREQSPPLNQLPYLIHQYIVNYAYAASLLKGKRHSNVKSYEHPISFLGIAPSFENMDAALLATRSCSDEPLGRLKHNQTEVIEIKKKIGGELLLGTAANKANFLEKARESKIVHISSHACAGSSAEDSRIYLQDEAYINMYDLYPVKLSSEMMVLSACETATGSLIKGEGIMSLARGFFYTGIPSLTTTLWPVDDKATSLVMQLYYKHLKKGLRKDEALREAKLEFIKEADYNEDSYPVYWASFVHFGDVEAIYKGNKKNRTKIVGLLMLVLLTVLSVFIYKRK